MPVFAGRGVEKKTPRVQAEPFWRDVDSPGTALQ
jgi:hypothetical protein